MCSGRTAALALAVALLAVYVAVPPPGPADVVLKACFEGDLAAVRAREANLTRVTDAFGNGCAHWAAKGGRVAVLRLLRAGSGGGWCEARNVQNTTVLHWATYARDTEALEFLLDWCRGTDIVRAGNADGEVPLHWAVQFENDKAVSLLLRHGADPNAADRDGDLPLHRLDPRCSSQRCMAIAAACVKHGSDMHVANALGRLPLKTDEESRNMRALYGQDEK